MKYYIFGVHPCLFALENKQRRLIKIYTSQTVFNKYKKEILKSKVPYIIEKERFFNKISTSSQHFVIYTYPIQTNITSKNIYDDKKIIILDHLQDSGNVGAIIRSAYAFGVKTIILPLNNSASENGQMVKSSAGYIEKINLIYVNSIQSTIKILKKHHFWVVGLSAYADKTLANEIQPNEKLCFVLGSEGLGMSKTTTDACDILYKIPSITESLNVSTSCAIVLYEFRD